MHPSPFQDAITHGEHLFHTGHMHEALQVFESVLAQEPHNVLALNDRGVILHGLGMYAEAEQTFLDILHQDESNANAVFNLLTIYIDQYNIHSAEDIIIRYGDCLSTQDINEIKVKLRKIQREINIIDGHEKTRLLNISMDISTKRHILKLYLNEREPSHRCICECFAKNTLYKPGLSNFFASVLQENDSFIDIGAHIGYFSLLGSTLVGQHGSVFSFEPEEKNYRRLHENIALNNFDNIKAFDIALGSEDKTAKLFVNSDDDAGHALWNIGRHPDHLQSRLNCITRDVRVASLDSLLQGTSLHNIRLVHIDTCGTEFDIIQGAVSAILDNRVPYVICGINRFGLQQMGASENELRLFMSYMGYEAYWIRSEAPHLVSLAPDQYVESERDLYLLFANPAFLGEDNAHLGRNTTQRP